MSTTQVALGFPTGTNLFRETDLENTALTVKATSGTLYMLDLDNTANGGAASYVKLYDSAGAVVVGTTAPDDIIRVPAGVRQVVHYVSGKAFANGLQCACVTTGGTAGSTAPSSAVIVQVVYS